ncbi:CDH12 [Mytilus edulis]|uniref:CDH12 n=1 Tax=Mytilus edulis TaxID=6550 RepID=A0A8S3V891_MYTED|nr:CDH12 [Mytilus edulis]
MDRISELIDLDFCTDESIHVIITQPEDELCDIETDSDSENEMSEEEQHIDHHALAVQFCLQKETLASEENFQEGMKEFVETIVTIANGKHLTEKHEINATLEPGIENATLSRPRLFQYSEGKQLTLPEFHRRYRENLPLLVIVTKGFNGETHYDDYATNQIIRFHRACQQPRALARLSTDAGSQRDEFLSIPVDGKYKFAVVKSLKKVGNPQLMKEILAENNLPVQVRYSSYNIELRSTLESIKGVNILIMKTYVEDNIQGNCLEDGVISPVSALVAICPDISVSIITGYTHKSQEQFQAKLRSMDNFVQRNIKFKDNEGSPELTKFERGAKTTGTGNAVPPDLLPRDYSHGGDYNDVPPKLIPRQKSKSVSDEQDDIYEALPEPDPEWLPPRPQKYSAEKRPPLPARPYDSLSTVVEDQNYRVMHADESLNLESSDNYMYISETCVSDSDYNSSTNSWSAGSSKSFVTEKSVQEILGILKTLNLSKYCKEFADQLVDGTVLQELSEEILRKDFNFMHVEAVRLMKYVRSGHIPI